MAEVTDEVVASAATADEVKEETKAEEPI